MNKKNKNQMSEEIREKKVIERVGNKIMEIIMSMKKNKEKAHYTSKI